MSFHKMNIKFSGLMLLHLLLLCSCVEFSNATKPYCDINQTSVTYIPVTKSRQIVKPPTGFFKFVKKSKTYTEKYTDNEEHVTWKLISGCCEGYRMTALQICEPICAMGCPQNANCIEPNRCECQNGYVSATSPTNGTHYCEPVCRHNCPEHGHCVAPNMCECERGFHVIDDRCVPYCSSNCPYGGECIRPEECSCTQGYRTQAGTCVPICEKGDGCKNGVCIETETCECNVGYSKNEETEICEALPCDTNQELCFGNIISTTEVYSTLEMQNTISPETFQLATDSDDIAMENDTTDVSETCEPDFIYYNGECRSKIFASNEVDCRFKPCTQNAHCQSNGTCICLTGFIWYKPNLDDTSEWQCLTELQVQERLQNIRALSSDDAANDDDDDDDHNWTAAFLIAIGLFCIACAIFYLIMKLLRQQSGRLDVEGKHDLYCEYDNKTSNEIPDVL